MTEAELMGWAHRIYVGSLFTVCLLVAVHRIAHLKAGWKLLLALNPMRRTAAVLLANWAVNTAFVIASGIHDPWLWFIAVDVVSAAIIMHQPAGKAQAAIGWAYMAQIIMHCVYGVSNPAVAENAYWQILTALAFVQLILVGGWAVGHGVRARYHRWHRRRSQVASVESRKGVAR